MTLRGEDVVAIRQRLGLPVAPFAELLGVAPSTVYRWEALGAGAVPAEIHPARVLLLLHRHVATRRDPESYALADDVMGATLTGGGLCGLHRLLRATVARGGTA